MEELSRASFINTELAEKPCRALVDTGADWSLFDAKNLTGEDHRTLWKYNAKECPKSRLMYSPFI